MKNVRNRYGNKIGIKRSLRETKCYSFATDTKFLPSDDVTTFLPSDDVTKFLPSDDVMTLMIQLQLGRITVLEMANFTVMSHIIELVVALVMT